MQPHSTYNNLGSIKSVTLLQLNTKAVDAFERTGSYYVATDFKKNCHIFLKMWVIMKTLYEFVNHTYVFVITATSTEFVSSINIF